MHAHARSPEPDSIQQKSDHECFNRISNGAISPDFSLPPSGPLSGIATTETLVSLFLPGARLMSPDLTLLASLDGTTGVTFFEIPPWSSAAAPAAEDERY